MDMRSIKCYKLRNMFENDSMICFQLKKISLILRFAKKTFNIINKLTFALQRVVKNNTTTNFASILFLLFRTSLSFLVDQVSQGLSPLSTKERKEKSLWKDKALCYRTIKTLGAQVSIDRNRPLSGAPP